MPFPTYYSTGTASVANGETSVAFAGAGLGTAEFPFVSAGDIFFDPAQPGIPGQRLASVDYEAASVTLWAGWPGTTMEEAPFEIRFTDDSIRSTGQTRRYLELLGQLDPLGIQPKAFGLFAGRVAYDDEAKGYIYLSLDGDGGLTTSDWTLSIKLSGDTADWDDGQSMAGAPGDQGEQGDPGPQGDQGDPGPANELTIGSVEGGPTAEAEITGIAPNQVLNLTLPQGSPGNAGWSPVLATVADGARRVHQVVDWAGGAGVKPATGLYVSPTGLTATIGDATDVRGSAGAGSGDVNSAGAVTSGRLAQFADGTGDVIEDAGVAVGELLPKSIMTTRGDIITRGAAAPARLALGAQYKLLQAGATDLAYDALQLNQEAAVAGVLAASHLPDASVTAKGISEFATAAEFRTGTDTVRSLVVDQVWAAAALKDLTDGANIAVDLSTGFNFGGVSNAVLAIAANASLSAPSGLKTGQSGILWFGAAGATRTLTLNAAWLLFDGVEVGPYSITTAQELGLSYVVRASRAYVAAILRRAA